MNVIDLSWVNLYFTRELNKINNKDAQEDKNPVRSMTRIIIIKKFGRLCRTFLYQHIVSEGTGTSIHGCSVRMWS